MKGRVYVVSKEAPVAPEASRDDAGHAGRTARARRAQPAAEPAGRLRAVHRGGAVRMGRRPSGLPPIGPPWSQITAFDLNKGTLLWQVPNGDTRQLVARGVRGTGSQGARAGMVVTAGGLLFIGTPDHTLRAYDEDTGRVVWAREMSGPINGVPAIYELDGRQYLAVCVGAAGASTPRTRAPRRRERAAAANTSSSR